MPFSFRLTRREVGTHEETKALDHFQRKGWLLLARNYRCRAGEVDLIFREGRDTVVFVEVKYRTRSDFGTAQSAVGAQKQRRLIQTALHYIKANRLNGVAFRFDVAAITPDGLEHIPNAFPAEGYTL